MRARPSSPHYEDYCHRVNECIKTRLSWSDLQLMRDIIAFLSSHGWEKLLEDDDLVAINRLLKGLRLHYMVPMLTQVQ